LSNSPVSVAQRGASSSTLSHSTAADARAVLYLHPNTMGFSTDPLRNPLHHLSQFCRGDYVAVAITPDRASARDLARRITAASGRFTFRWTWSRNLPPLIRPLWDLLYFIGTGLYLTARNGRYDVVMAYGPYRTGFAGWIVSRLTGARFILEIPGNPRMAHDFSAGMLTSMKRRIAPRVVSFLVRRADHLRLRYPDQLEGMDAGQPGRTSVFPNFIPVALIPRRYETDERYVLFIGYPWKLKGVDILIQAFERISAKHPDVRLKIVGYCPDRAPFERLANGNPRIEFHDPVPNERAMELMAGCEVFVLASRTDAFARVLVEAMAAERPIVASRVDGTPHYILDGERGLLFDSENVEQLAERIDRLLSNPGEARRLAANGYHFVHEELSEHRYAESFRDMIDSTLR
jgi:glycosyltransferase involved in cell wall biosynthesis